MRLIILIVHVIIVH